MFIYSDNEKRGSFNFGAISKMDPTELYCSHLGNWFYLKFILMNSKVLVEISQANKELTICERKLEFWKRQPGFDSVSAQTENAALKKKWNMIQVVDIFSI